VAKKRRRPSHERCTYCRSAISGSAITEDHVIGRRWYPVSTPSSVARSWVYACEPCNNKKSHLEQCMLVRLAMCADPTVPASNGVWDRAKRSMDYQNVRDPAEREKRKRVHDAIMRDMEEVTSLPQAGVLPSFLRNYELGSRTTIKVPADMLNSLIEFWALGFHRIAWGEPASATARLEVQHVAVKDAITAFRGTEGRWKTFYGGPGVQIALLPGRDSARRVTVYAFAIWDQFRAYAVVDEDSG
jgi:hypothetical protein